MTQITPDSLAAAKAAFEVWKPREEIIAAAIPGASEEEKDWWESLLYAHWHTVKTAPDPYEFKQAAYELVCMVEAAQRDFFEVCGDPLSLTMYHPVELGRAIGRARMAAKIEGATAPLLKPTEIISIANKATLVL